MCHDGRSGTLQPAADPALDCFGHYNIAAIRCRECKVVMFVREEPLRA